VTTSFDDEQEREWCRRTAPTTYSITGAANQHFLHLDKRLFLRGLLVSAEEVALSCKINDLAVSNGHNGAL
jgi:hypothetical protein